jgi:shikimate kinase
MRDSDILICPSDYREISSVMSSKDNTDGDGYLCNYIRYNMKEKSLFLETDLHQLHEDIEKSENMCFLSQKVRENIQSFHEKKKQLY